MASGGASPIPSSVATPRTSTPSMLNPNTTPPQVKICVYCGASSGKGPKHIEAAQALGKAMAARNIGLVYGGGTVGLMGEVAKTIVSINGPGAVHGIIPEALVKWERDDTYAAKRDANGYHVPEEHLYGRTTVVKDMHTRKRMMAQEVLEGGPGSGFIALSGGFGTMEELLETATWNQLGIHSRGVCVLNIDGFYDGLLDWIRKAVDEEFLKASNGSIIVTASDAEGAIEALQNYKVSDARYGLDWSQQ
ncbi:putative lysine decarboxylase-like protein [Rosellinia necatrix]|uniref:Putative lysine decarboxylase-like protein n=1 Tax=Rosellinia necatrix TaxID=77044 RepID=A0A1W2TT59_ROSNE|nr:putative lysine decarboxylase-like protein [Rosellinia necatrix]